MSVIDAIDKTPKRPLYTRARSEAEMRSKKVIIRLTLDQWSRVKKEAADKGVTISELFRSCYFGERQ